MRIDDLEWTLDRLEHVARHGVTPEEVEEVLGSIPFFKRGRGGVYEAWGQTDAGRYLLVVFRYLGHNRAWPITARDMDEMKRDSSEKNKAPHSRQKLTYAKSVVDIPDFKSDDETAAWYQTHSTVLVQDQLETFPASAGGPLRARVKARRARVESRPKLQRA